MPFDSEAQRRFMFAKHPKIAEEFQAATPKDADLPERVQKMSDGGTTNAETIEPGVYGDTDPGHFQAIIDSLAGGMSAGSVGGSLAADLPAALKGMGEAGEVTLGRAAPEMEGMGPKVEVFSKGVMGKGTPNATTIWGVKGDPKEVAKLGYGEDPGSIPEHILQKHGLLPEAKVAVPNQPAPNTYSEGGIVEKMKKMLDTDKSDAAQANMVDPAVPAQQSAALSDTDMAAKQGGDSTDMAKQQGEAMGMSKGGFPHVTFMEDQTPQAVKKTVHMDEPTHEQKFNAVRKAMGMKMADGGTVPDEINPADLPGGVTPPPAPNSPGWMDWVKNALAQVSNSPAGQVASAVMNPVDAIADAVKGAAPAIMNAEGPAASKVAGVMAGAPAAAPAPAPSPAAGPAPALPAATPPPAAAPAMPPVAIAPAAKIPNPVGNLFNQDTSGLTAGSNPSDRQALSDQLGKQQHSWGEILAQAVSGIGDALAAKGGREQHSLQGIFAMNTQQRNEALANFDAQRQMKLQKLDLQSKMGQNAVQQLAAQDAYGVDDHLNKILNAPAGTAHKDLPLYFQAQQAGVQAAAKDSELRLASHKQAADEVDNAVKNASFWGTKPSAAQIEAKGDQLADKYYHQAKGNALIKASDGSMHWIPSQNMAAAQKLDPGLQVQP